MQLNKKQFEKIAPLLPKQRGNVKIPSLVIINALLYIVENGCKWRALPKQYGPWHTVYMRFNRWVQKALLTKYLTLCMRNLILPLTKRFYRWIALA